MSKIVTLFNMAFLARGKKQDLIELPEALDVTIGRKFKVLEIRDAIVKTPTCDVKFVKECLNCIIGGRKELEQCAVEKEKMSCYLNKRNLEYNLVLLPKVKNQHPCFLP